MAKGTVVVHGWYKLRDLLSEDKTKAMIEQATKKAVNQAINRDMRSSDFVINRALYDLLKSAGLIPADVDRARKIIITAEVGSKPTIEVTYYPVMNEPGTVTKRFVVVDIEDKGESISDPPLDDPRL